MTMSEFMAMHTAKVVAAGGKAVSKAKAIAKGPCLLCGGRMKKANPPER